jgi:hypothetical protein
LPYTVKGTDVTKSGATMPNYETDMTRSEFESTLSKLVWAKESSSGSKGSSAGRWNMRGRSKTQRPTINSREALDDEPRVMTLLAMLMSSQPMCVSWSRCGVLASFGNLPPEPLGRLALTTLKFTRPHIWH